MHFTLTHDPITIDQHFDALEALDSYHPAGTLSEDGATTTYAITVSADSALGATEVGAEAIRQATRDWPGRDIVAASATLSADMAHALTQPEFPEVVGYTEIAELAGVSRQRAHQFTKMEGFPPPVIETAQGPLMRKSSVEAWVRRRNTHAGRRRKVNA